MSGESVTLCVACAAGVVGLALTYAVVKRRKRLGRRGRWIVTPIILLAGLLSIIGFVVAGWVVWFTHRSQPAPEQRELFLGVTYTREVRQSPRPVVIHVVTIDLTQPGRRFIVTPPEPVGDWPMKARTTSRFLYDHHAKVAINANYFRPFYSKGPLASYPHEGDGVECIGLAGADGVVYSGKPWHEGTMFFGADGAVSFDQRPVDLAAAISGNGYVVLNGQPGGPPPRGATTSPAAPSIEPFFYPDSPDAVNGLDARSAVGVDRDRTHVYFVVVDGKQPSYSEGMTMPEFAQALLSLGIDTAIRTDEGGSATLVAEGPNDRPVILNSPIHGRIPGRQRPVANHLGLVVK